MFKRNTTSLILLFVMLVVSGVTAVFANVDPIMDKPDLGDAPTSYNSYGVAMMAYPGVTAKFPTTYLAGLEAGLPGPWHVNEIVSFNLGEFVSGERDADLGFDEDPTNNLIINAMANVANQDLYDDGLVTPLSLPHCQWTQISYIVTVYELVQEDAYVNVWLDWDRNGAWADQSKLLCRTGDSATEWVTQNQKISFPNPGTYLLTTPPFLAWNPNPLNAKWLRISVSDRPAPPQGNEMGVGPEGGYKYGETEDHRIVRGLSVP